jgi:hypothetical protein
MPKRAKSSSSNTRSSNLARYAAKHGLTPEQARNLRKQLRATKRQKQAVVPVPSLAAQDRRWIAHRDKLGTLPVYYIACHGSTCSNYSQCVPSRAPGVPFFHVPKDTYMINIVNGEYCVLSSDTEKRIPHLHTLNTFRKLLLIDSPNEAVQQYGPKQFPFISTVSRSSPGAEYPDYMCIFPDKSANFVDFKGVYNLDWPTSNLLPAKSPYADAPETWFIQDILTLFGRGIYFYGGCTTPYSRSERAVKMNDKATSMVRYNELNFSSTNPTLSSLEISALDPASTLIDYGISHSKSAAHPAEMVRLALEHDVTPKVLFDGLATPSDLEKAEVQYEAQRKVKT